MQSHLFAGADISASGMSAERQRMEVVANNIANANATKTAEGGPYRRQQLVFSAALDDAGNASGLRGVEVSDARRHVRTPADPGQPGHPNADRRRVCLMMPNVKLPNEMVDLDYGQPFLRSQPESVDDVQADD